MIFCVLNSKKYLENVCRYEDLIYLCTIIHEQPMQWRLINT